MYPYLSSIRGASPCLLMTHGFQRRFGIQWVSQYCKLRHFHQTRGPLRQEGWIVLAWHVWVWLSMAQKLWLRRWVGWHGLTIIWFVAIKQIYPTAQLSTHFFHWTGWAVQVVRPLQSLLIPITMITMRKSHSLTHPLSLLLTCSTCCYT